MEYRIYQQYLDSVEDANDILIYQGIYGLLENFVFWLNHNGFLTEAAQEPPTSSDGGSGAVCRYAAIGDTSCDCPTCQP